MGKIEYKLHDGLSLPLREAVKRDPDHLIQSATTKKVVARTKDAKHAFAAALLTLEADISGARTEIAFSPDVLAKGGYSALFAGVDIHDRSRRYAIKDVSVADGPQPANAQTMSAADVTSEITHAQLAGSAAAPMAGLQVGTEIYLVMDAMPTNLTSMTTALRRCSPALRSNVTIVILQNLLPQLDRLHREGKLHRDIKPDNVLVDPKNRACLGDFGLATAVGDVSDGKGTVDYMPPELLDGKIDQAYDIWSLGVMALELATGRYLFGQHAKASDPYFANIWGRTARYRAWDKGGRDAGLAQVFASVHHRGLRATLKRMLAANAEKRPAASTLSTDLGRLFLTPQARQRATRFLAGQHGFADAVGARLSPIEQALSHPEKLDWRQIEE